MQPLEATSLFNVFILRYLLCKVLKGQCFFGWWWGGTFISVSLP